MLKLFTIREQNTEVWTVIYPHVKFEKSAPVTIEMFDKVKLTTSTKVSSLYLVTTGGVLRRPKKWSPTVPLMESKK